MSRPKPAADRQGHTNIAPVSELALVDSEPIPDPPAYLEEPGDLELWEATWLAGGGHYHPGLHYEIVAQFVEVTSELNEMRIMLRKEDGGRKYLSSGSTGQIQTYALRKDFKDTRDQQKRLLIELGKTPEASVRLNMAAQRYQSVMDTVRNTADASFVDVDDVEVV